jgi:spoIIIJ-associated protein
MMDREESIVYAKKFIEDVLSFFGLNVDVNASADEEVIELSVPSSYLNSLLIGQRGDNLRSLQYLTAQSLFNRGGQLHRVNVDVGDYKRARNERLAAQAEDWAKEVLETGGSMELKPMNPAERRVVHKVIGEYSELTTESIGEGRDRHVVLSKKA